MPRKDGYQACREIRQWEKTAHHPKMPIIALSANVMSDVPEKCVAAGFSDYVTKPVDFIDLSRAMAKFFSVENRGSKSKASTWDSSTN
jgi:CheY-like chemotaxis protein